MEERLILAINPGSTSTKLTVYNNEECICKNTIAHDADSLAPFNTVEDQEEYRTGLIMDFLDESGIDKSHIAAVVGRGGFLPGKLYGGTYIIDDEVLYGIKHAIRSHAANLGTVIAKTIADKLGVPAYVVDPVTVNETSELGYVSGMEGIKRQTMFHCLNVKAVARKAAAQLGGKYEELNLIITHMGGGISTSAHENGMAVDATNGILGEGTFSPERAGTVGLKDMLDLCFNSGKTRKELEVLLCGKGGMVSYLGTNDCRKAEQMIEDGDLKAKLIYEAMAYQICKDIAAMASVLKGKVDGICLTGGMAFSKMLTCLIKERVSFIAPVMLFPGEFEQEAMTLGALRVLNGETQAKHYKRP